MIVTEGTISNIPPARASAVFVVFDSNIWISQRGLKSARGEEAKNFIRTKGATLAVPEVVRIEVEKNLRDELRRQRKKIEEGHRYFTTLSDGGSSLSLPADADIETLVSGLMDNVEVETRQIPLTVEAAKSSFEKIVNGVQPSDRREQFADGVVWANCLELLDEGDVCLVSEDKAFFRNRRYDDGIAPDLATEKEQHPHTLRLFRGLEELLQGADRDVSRVIPGDGDEAN